MIWINIKDKLPEEDNQYLVFVPTLDENSPFIGIGWYEPSGYGWSLLPRAFIEGITHSMPLPKPPSEN